MSPFKYNFCRILTSTEEDDTDSAPSSMSTVFFNISVDVRYSNHKMSGVVCVKRGPVVEAEKSLSTQLRLMTLSEGVYVIILLEFLWLL